MRYERVESTDGVREVTTLERRIRFADKPIRRLRVAATTIDVQLVLSKLPADRRRMVERLLKEGLGRHRRWDALVRRPPSGFVAILVEDELLAPLCRCGALEIVDRWSTDGEWRTAAVRTRPAGAAAIGHRDPACLRAELLEALTSDDLRARAANGPPTRMSWRAFSFVLRAVERWRDLHEHDSAPRPKELAAQIEHSKMWTDARRRLFAEVCDKAWEDLFPKTPRQLRIKGPVEHPQAALWAESVGKVPLRVLEEARGIVCVENHETFEHLLTHADVWVVLQVPGGPPPAEVELLGRLHHLAPHLPVLAAFDPDPAGIQIALAVADGAGVELSACLMSPEALSRATPLPLTDQDRRWLIKLEGRATVFEPLRAAIAERDHKGEQEPIHGWLDAEIAEHICAAAT